MQPDDQLEQDQGQAETEGQDQAQAEAPGDVQTEAQAQSETPAENQAQAEQKPRRGARSRQQPAAEPAEEPEAEGRDAATPEGAPAPGRARARKTAAAPQGPRPVPRLLAKYREEVRPSMVREFAYKTPMQAPRLVKMVVNMGLGEALQNPRALETASEQMAAIAGQRPVITKARKSVANFKIREGMAIGSMVTVRGYRMYEFMDRLVSVALPRIRDFRGLSRSSFDGHGNYSLGIREQVVFPEVDYNQIDRIRGLQVTITTSARNDQEGCRLLELLGMPFVRNGEAG